MSEQNHKHRWAIIAGGEGTGPEIWPGFTATDLQDAASSFGDSV